ncbi:8648_t:CDS:2, partial [Gigaspora rosea]
MMWDEVSESQGYRWIDVLLQFVIAYNKAPHEAYKKSPYKAFFGFKMRAVYNTLNTPENNTPEDNTPGTILPEHIPPGTIPPEHIPSGTIPSEHILQEHIPLEHIPSLVIRGSVHRRKVTFELGDKVAVAPDFDNNQKTRKRKLEQTCSITGKVV